MQNSKNGKLISVPCDIGDKVYCIGIDTFERDKYDKLVAIYSTRCVTVRSITICECIKINDMVLNRECFLEEKDAAELAEMLNARGKNET